MFSNVSEKITNVLVENGTISAKDKELYSYGFRQLFLIIINLCTIIIVGLIGKELWQVIIFTLSYIPIRSFAGGYHANTPLRCYFFSILMMLAFILIIKFLNVSIIPIVLMVLCSVVIISLFAPTQDKNKPLDDLEKKVYKKRSLILLSIEVLAILIFILLNMLEFSSCIALALTFLSIILIMGRIKNRKLTMTKI